MQMTKMAGVTQAKPWFAESGVFTTRTIGKSIAGDFLFAIVVSKMGAAPEALYANKKM